MLRGFCLALAKTEFFLKFSHKGTKRALLSSFHREIFAFFYG
ncbi:MAG: hypothetical protein QOH31_4133 [Verrucomicrobiota bacterium]|jgi:hypothetical protein